MFNLDLEKAEEPKIKLPPSVGSSKKQESSRKTSTSALLTMPKSYMDAKAGLTILISDQADFRKSMIRDKDEHYMMIKGSILNVYLLNRTSKYM